MSLAGKVAVITGAASGIGAATAVLFAKEGAKVALIDKDEAKLNNTAKLCTEHGSEALVIKVDLSKDEETSIIIKKTIERFGQLDVLVNCAGFGKAGTLLGGDIMEAYDVVMAVNIRAMIYLTTLAVPYLVKTKGNIVNISSCNSLRVFKQPNMIAYNISKAAVDHFTRCAALELAPKGVRVNSVNPGPVKTGMLQNSNITDIDSMRKLYKKSTALGKIAEPEEIADLVLFLASDKAKSMTGSIYVIDNGLFLKGCSC